MEEEQDKYPKRKDWREVGWLQAPFCTRKWAINLHHRLQGKCMHEHVILSEEFKKSWNQGKA